MQRRWTVLSLLLAAACGDSSAGTSQIIRWDGSEWTLHSNLFPGIGRSACLSMVGPGDMLAITYDDDYGK